MCPRMPDYIYLRYSALRHAALHEAALCVVRPRHIPFYRFPERSPRFSCLCLPSPSLSREKNASERGRTRHEDIVRTGSAIVSSSILTWNCRLDSFYPREAIRASSSAQNLAPDAPTALTTVVRALNFHVARFGSSFLRCIRSRCRQLDHLAGQFMRRSIFPFLAVDIFFFFFFLIFHLTFPKSRRFMRPYVVRVN